MFQVSTQSFFVQNVSVGRGKRSLLNYFRKLRMEENTIDREDWKAYFPTIKCKLHEIRNFA